VEQIQTLRTPICFLDETGTLHAARDPFFAVGMLKSHRPEVLTRAIRIIRDRAHFYEELKWANVDPRQRFLPQYEEVVSTLFRAPATEFSCYVLDKRRIDPVARYGDLWRAYEEFAALQVAYNTHDDEIPTILADDMSTPPGVLFEESLRANIQARGKRVGGICRVDSKGVALVQVADLLVGAVAYAHKLDAGMVNNPSAAKLSLMEHIRVAAGLASLAQPSRRGRLRIHLLR
jgi:hypothetical protein